jgi:hypothetical protein
MAHASSAASVMFNILLLVLGVLLALVVDYLANTMSVSVPASGCNGGRYRCWVSRWELLSSVVDEIVGSSGGALLNARTQKTF